MYNGIWGGTHANTHIRRCMDGEKYVHMHIISVCTCVLYIYAYIYVNTYRHISNNMISWCVQTWNSPKYSDFDEKNISFQTKIQGFFPTAESMADVVYSSNIYQISLSSLVPCFFSICMGFIWLMRIYIGSHGFCFSKSASTAFEARTCSSVGLRHGPTLWTW